MHPDECKQTTELVSVNRHPQYYFEEGIIFCVEKTHFKVPRRKLCLVSSIFDDLFIVPASQIEGVADERPIVLQGVSTTDFERLLTYLYPLTTNYTQFTKEWTFDYWHSILKVAHQYMMEDICTEVIQVLDKISFPDPLTMIQCGLQFEHPPWVRQGYSELVFRQHPLSIEEARLLGFENAVRCAAARESYRAMKGCDVHWALDKWFTGTNKLPPDPWASECDLYDPRDEP